MFIDKDELTRRLHAENNLVERLASTPIVPIEAPLDTKKFTNTGLAREVPAFTPEERALIGATTLAVGAEVASDTFGVSKSYAKVLARGTYSQATDPEERERRNQELKDNIYEGLAVIRERAREKLMMALEGIDEEALSNIKASDRAKILANVSNQLSSVIDRTINKGEHLTDGRSTHLHLYAPEVRPLSAFTIKTINQDANSTSSSE